MDAFEDGDTGERVQLTEACAAAKELINLLGETQNTWVFRRDGKRPEIETVMALYLAAKVLARLFHPSQYFTDPQAEQVLNDAADLIQIKRRPVAPSDTKAIATSLN